LAQLANDLAHAFLIFSSLSMCSSLYNIAIDRTTSPAAVEREVVRRIKAHTGLRLAPWEVSCVVMVPPEKGRAQMDIVYLSEAGDRRYVLCDGTVAEVGEGFQQVLQKVTKYEQKAVRLIRGSAYEFGDFCVRAGLSFDKGSPVGVVVEIEYRPCAYVEQCAALIGELMERIAAPLVPPPHAGQDPSTIAAANSSYTCERVSVDIAKLLPDDPPAFSLRHAAMLYVKLLS
jgi:TATA-binding related factor (TRF) of subunit 20 of Mediator complex